MGRLSQIIPGWPTVITRVFIKGRQDDQTCNDGSRGWSDVEQGMWIASRTSLSNLWPVGCMWPRMALNVAYHKFVNFLKAL